MACHSRSVAILLVFAAACATAPACSAKDLDAPTLLIKHRFNINVINNSLQIYNDYLLLLPDGTAYENSPREGLKDITAAKLAAEAKERPHDLGKWKRVPGSTNGDGIETTFTRSMYDSQIKAARDKVEVQAWQKTDKGGWSKEGKHENWNTYAPAIPLDAKKLLGPWELDEKIITAGTAYGTAPMITVVRARNYTFYGDGKFSTTASQFVSSKTTSKGLDDSRFTVSTYDHSPEKGEAGTYKLDADNLSITLSEAGGKQRTVTAFIVPLWGDPEKKPSIVIDGQRFSHPESDAAGADANANAAKPADPQKPAPAAHAVVAGTKFAHFRFELPKGWTQSEVDGSLMLRPERGAEKGIGILLFPPEPHKGNEDLASFEKWFDETRAWLDEDRTVLQGSKPTDKNQGRYPMRMQVEIIKKPDESTQARVYVGIKRGDRHAELIVMFAPDVAALTEVTETLNTLLGSITLETD